MTEIHTESGSATARLQALGLDLPAIRENSKYVNHRALDSEHLRCRPAALQGRLAAGSGHRGPGRRGGDGPWARAHAVLNCLAVAADAVGGLDRVRIVQMLVFVASTPELGKQSHVADAASDLLLEVLGENGRHARTAIGVASLPLNSPVESRWSARRCRSGTGGAPDSFCSEGIGRTIESNPFDCLRNEPCTGFNECSTACSTGWTRPCRSCSPM